MRCEPAVNAYNHARIPRTLWPGDATDGQVRMVTADQSRSFPWDQTATNAPSRTEATRHARAKRACIIQPLTGEVSWISSEDWQSGSSDFIRISISSPSYRA